MASWSGACYASTRPLKGITTKQQPAVLAGFYHLQNPSYKVQHISLHSMLALPWASDAGFSHLYSHASITWQTPGHCPGYEQYMPGCKSSKYNQTIDVESCKTGRQRTPALKHRQAPEADMRSRALPGMCATPAPAPLEDSFVTPRGQSAAGANLLSAQGAAARRAPPVQCTTQASGAGPPVQPAGANAQHQATEAQEARDSTSRSLAGALASRPQSRGLQVAASPLYVSRSERQSVSVSQRGVVNQRMPHVPPSLTASPAISEMIYSLPGTPMSQSWLAGRDLSRSGFTPTQAAQGSSSSASGALHKALPASVHAQPAYAVADEAGLLGRLGSSEATIAASVRDEPPGCLPAGQADRSLGHEQDPRAQAQHTDGAQLGGADTAVPLSKTPNFSFTSREIDEQPVERSGRARLAAERQQNPYPLAGSVAQPEVLSRRQTDSSYVSCKGGECQGGPEGTPLDYSGFSSDMRAHANATAESLFRQAEASTAGNSAERSSHPDGGGIQQGAACFHAEPSRALICDMLSLWCPLFVYAAV